MEYFTAIDNYCERLDPSLWAEPLNALTNASFFIAAWFVFKAGNSFHARLLAGLIALVGLGSTLFHTFANRLTMLGDVIPIAIFTFVYLWLAMRHLAAFNRIQSVLGLVLFILAAVVAGAVPDPYRLNGSIAYIPCLLAMLSLAALMHKTNRPAARMLFLTALLFSGSLFFRSVDMAWCDALPLGTHIMWHLLNGLVLYRLSKTLLLFHCKPEQKV